ncbi:hypothetical protein HDU98_003338, partial [Podochytrium sp. JEL0797]
MNQQAPPFGFPAQPGFFHGQPQGHFPLGSLPPPSSPMESLLWSRCELPSFVWFELFLRAGAVLSQAAVEKDNGAFFGWQGNVAVVAPDFMWDAMRKALQSTVPFNPGQQQQQQQYAPQHHPAVPQQHPSLFSKPATTASTNWANPAPLQPTLLQPSPLPTTQRPVSSLSTLTPSVPARTPTPSNNNAPLQALDALDHPIPALASLPQEFLKEMEDAFGARKFCYHVTKPYNGKLFVAPRGDDGTEKKFTYASLKEICDKYSIELGQSIKFDEAVRSATARSRETTSSGVPAMNAGTASGHAPQQQQHQQPSLQQTQSQQQQTRPPKQPYQQQQQHVAHSDGGARDASAGSWRGERSEGGERGGRGGRGGGRGGFGERGGRGGRGRGAHGGGGSGGSAWVSAAAPGSAPGTTNLNAGNAVASGQPVAAGQQQPQASAKPPSGGGGGGASKPASVTGGGGASKPPSLKSSTPPPPPYLQKHDVKKMAQHAALDSLNGASGGGGEKGTGLAVDAHTGGLKSAGGVTAADLSGNHTVSLSGTGA